MQKELSTTKLNEWISNFSDNDTMPFITKSALIDLEDLELFISGYLLKKDSPQKILDAIKELNEGKASMNGLIAKKVMEYFHKKKAAANVDEFNLTKREH